MIQKNCFGSEASSASFLYSLNQKQSRFFQVSMAALEKVSTILEVTLLSWSFKKAETFSAGNKKKQVYFNEQQKYLKNLCVSFKACTSLFGM